jgi:hypothetical protein
MRKGSCVTRLMGYIGQMAEPEPKKRVKRRKPKEKRREAYLRVRLTTEQDTTIRAAADAAGITISAWAVERLFRAAKEETERKSLT